MSEQVPSGDLKSLVRLPYEKLEALEKQFRPAYEPDSNQKPDADLVDRYFLYANCAFALALLEKRKSDWPRSERFRELISGADHSLTVLALLDEADEFVDFPLLESHLSLQLFGISAADGNFEYAVYRLLDGLDQPWEWRPEQQLFDPQQAVHCFEQLKAQPDRVVDWAKVASCCKDLLDLLDWNADMGFDGETEVKDDGGRPRTFRDYWLEAIGFAKARLSPDEYRAWKEREEREHAERHMEHLFFPDTWKQLPKLAKDALVQAEVIWWARDRSTKSAVVDNLWKATREIVLERLVAPFSLYAASGPIKGFAELKAVSLLTDGSDQPDLSELMKLTWQAPQFPEFTKTLGLGQQEYQFLLSVEKDLWSLIKLRNKSAHPDRGETLEPHDIEWAYRTFLGVGCEGILPRLAKLKTTTPQAKGH